MFFAVAVKEGSKASEVLGGIGLVVGTRCGEVNVRHHGPHRLTHQGRTLHGIEGAPGGIIGLHAEIGAEQRLGLSLTHLGVGGSACEVEHGSAEARVFEVDEPQALAVIEEIGGQQVMVAKDDGKRQLRRLESIRHCKQARQFSEERALPLAQRSVPEGADSELLGLLEAAKGQVGAARVAEGRWGAGADAGESARILVVYNAVLNALATLG